MSADYVTVPNQWFKWFRVNLVDPILRSPLPTDWHDKYEGAAGDMFECATGVAYEQGRWVYLEGLISHSCYWRYRCRDNPEYMQGEDHSRGPTTADIESWGKTDPLFFKWPVSWANTQDTSTNTPLRTDASQQATPTPTQPPAQPMTVDSFDAAWFLEHQARQLADNAHAIAHVCAGYF